MIVHHWDTDGITSAAIYENIHGEDNLFTPKIGNFYLDDEDFDYLKNFDKIVILDMNLPDIAKLCEYSEIYIYDHHRASKVKCAREHFNPAINGVFYPSCTTVLMERFEYSPDYLVALGIIGDKGDSAKRIEEWRIVEEVMRRENITYEKLKTAVELLDSSFKLMKRAEVIENVYLARNGIDAILNESKLQSNLELIEKEVEKWVSMAKDEGKFLFLHMRTDYQLISMVTRRLAWKMGKTAIVINTKADRDEFYIRSPNENFNAIPLIDIAKNMGYRAGGKKEVMGAILPKGEGEKFAAKILEVLKW